MDGWTLDRQAKQEIAVALQAEIKIAQMAFLIFKEPSTIRSNPCFPGFSPFSVTPYNPQLCQTITQSSI